MGYNDQHNSPPIGLANVLLVNVPAHIDPDGEREPAKFTSKTAPASSTTLQRDRLVTLSFTCVLLTYEKASLEYVDCPLFSLLIDGATGNSLSLRQQYNSVCQPSAKSETLGITIEETKSFR